MDHSSMAMKNGCCGMCAMMSDKGAAMSGMGGIDKPKSSGLLPPSDKSAAAPTCGDGGCGGSAGTCSCCGMMKKG